MRVVFRLSAIVVAFLAIAASLAACGQSGALYLPVVPPLPASRTAVPASDASEADAATAEDSASSADEASSPDAASAPDAASSSDTDSSPPAKKAPAKPAPSSSN
jgi:predicted small lipoprotein YifL